MPAKVRAPMSKPLDETGSQWMIEVKLPSGTLRLSGAVSREMVEVPIDCLAPDQTADLPH